MFSTLYHELALQHLCQVSQPSLSGTYPSSPHQGPKVRGL